MKPTAVRKALQTVATEEEWVPKKRMLVISIKDWDLYTTLFGTENSQVVSLMNTELIRRIVKGDWTVEAPDE